MSSVYRAQHVRLHINYAIKVYRSWGDGSGIKRFYREAKILAQLQHPHIVTIYDLAELPDGRMYIVMELLQGPDLGEVLRGPGRLPWQRVCDIALQIADALTWAHRRGIIHRDIKPQNCVLVENLGGGDIVKVIDFGIAYQSETEISSGDTPLTAPGGVIGTPQFMAPELFSGESPASPQSDIYSLGVLMYKALAGELPFRGQLFTMMSAIVEAQEAPRIRTTWPESDVPDRIEDVVACAMAPSPDKRPGSMEDFVALLRQSLVAVSIVGGSPLYSPPASSDTPGHSDTGTTRLYTTIGPPVRSEPGSQKPPEELTQIAGALGLTRVGSLRIEQIERAATIEQEREISVRAFVEASFGEWGGVVSDFLESNFEKISLGPRRSLRLESPMFGQPDPRYKFFAHGFPDSPGSIPDLQDAISDLGDALAEVDRGEKKDSGTHWIVVWILQSNISIQLSERAALHELRRRYRSTVLHVHTFTVANQQKGPFGHRQTFRSLVNYHCAPDLFKSRSPIENPLFFFGRDDAVDIVTQAITQGMSIINIVGAPETGKTSLINHLFRDAMEQPIYLRATDIDEQNLERFFSQFISAAPTTAEQEPVKVPQHVTQMMTVLLQKGTDARASAHAGGDSKAKRVFVVLEDADWLVKPLLSSSDRVITSAHFQFWRNVAVHASASNVTVLVTSTWDALSARQYEIIQVENPLRGYVTTVRMQGFDPSSIMRFIKTFEIDANVEFDSASISEIQRISGGFIALVKLIANRTIEMVHGERASRSKLAIEKISIKRKMVDAAIRLLCRDRVVFDPLITNWMNEIERSVLIHATDPGASKGGIQRHLPGVDGGKFELAWSRLETLGYLAILDNGRVETRPSLLRRWIQYHLAEDGRDRRDPRMLWRRNILLSGAALTILAVSFYYAWWQERFTTTDWARGRHCEFAVTHPESVTPGEPFELYALRSCPHQNRQSAEDVSVFAFDGTVASVGERNGGLSRVFEHAMKDLGQEMEVLSVKPLQPSRAGRFQFALELSSPDGDSQPRVLSFDVMPDYFAKFKRAADGAYKIAMVIPFLGALFIAYRRELYLMLRRLRRSTSTQGQNPRTE